MTNKEAKEIWETNKSHTTEEIVCGFPDGNVLVGMTIEDYYLLDEYFEELDPEASHKKVSSTPSLTDWHTEEPTDDSLDYLVAERDSSWEITSLTICNWNKQKKAFQYWSEYNDRDAYIYLSDSVKWSIIPPAWEKVRE